MNLLAQVDVTTTSSSSGDSTLLTILVIGQVVFYVLAIVGLWKTIDKTGQPGVWALLFLICPPIAMIPILKAVGRPTWWVVLFFIPLVNLVALIIVWIDLAKSFERSWAYGIGMLIFPFIFFLIFGFGPAQYRGPVVQSA